MKKVLVCGDRNWTDRLSIRTWLRGLQKEGYDTVIEGEARGADTIAREEAELLGMTVEKYSADWKKYGKAAGPIRNAEMLKADPDLVLAFHSDILKSKGTSNMIRQAKKRGVGVTLTDSLFGVILYIPEHI